MNGRLSFIVGKEGAREGRRLSIGGREGDLTTQVNGLKTLLHKKNLELENLKGKVEEGRQEGKEAQRLAQALTAVVEKMEAEKERAGREREEMMRELAGMKDGWEEAEGRARKKEEEATVLMGKMAEIDEQLLQTQARIKMASLSISDSSEKKQQQQQQQQQQLQQQLQQQEQLQKEREAEHARLLAISHAHCQEVEARSKKQESTILSLEADLRSLHFKLAQNHHEEGDRHKQKNTDLAKQQAAAATASRKAGELEAQVVSLNDMVELLTMDKEQLLIDQEVAEERMEGMSLEIETLKLELEHALEEAAAAAATATAAIRGAGPQGGGEEGEREDVTGQNQRLRAALKRLQEVNVQERQEGSRRERQLEKELAARECWERQAQDLLTWKKRKEAELESLHEQVEAGQAFAMMVEKLTEQNLGLEEKVSDLRLAVSELEVAQEMSEELEEGQAEEARQLRGECGRLMVLLAEKEEGLRQAEGRAGERERLLRRLKGVLGDLTRERDVLRDEVEERRMALGLAKERVEGVMEKVQGMRGQALLVRQKTMQAATATIEAWGARAHLERVLAMVPHEVWKECQGGGEGGGVEEGKALEGDLRVARVGAKVGVALEAMKEGGFAGLSILSSTSASMSLSASAAFPSLTALQRQGGETCQDRGNRAGHEGRLALTLSHIRHLAHFTLLHTQQQQQLQQKQSEEASLASSTAALAVPAATAATAAAARSAAAGIAFAPIERLLDELLLVLQEEGGVPESQFPLPPLLQALAHAENVLLPEGLKEGEGLGRLWEEVGAGGLVQLAPFLAVCLLIQAMMVEEEGKGGREEEVGEQGEAARRKMKEMVQRLEKEGGRCIVKGESMRELLLSISSTSGSSSSSSSISGVVARLTEDFASSSAAFTKLLLTNSTKQQQQQQQQQQAFGLSVQGVMEGWLSSLASIPTSSIHALGSSECLFTALGEGVKEGGKENELLICSTAHGLRAAWLRERLKEGMRMGPLVLQLQKIEKGLRQELRGREREEEALRAQVETLEEMMRKAREREKEREGLKEELERLEKERRRIGEENEVLSEALEVVQQQADALEGENRKLVALRGLSAVAPAGGGGGEAPSSSLRQKETTTETWSSNSGAGAGAGAGAADLPLVAVAALATMERAVRHAGRETNYWRAQATRQGLLQGLKPLVPLSMNCWGCSSSRSSNWRSSSSTNKETGSSSDNKKSSKSKSNNNINSSSSSSSSSSNEKKTRDFFAAFLSGQPPSPERTGRDIVEEVEGDEEPGREGGREELRRTLEDLRRLAGKVQNARSNPRVVSLVGGERREGGRGGGGERRLAHDRLVAQRVDAAMLVSEHRRLRSRVEELLGGQRAAAAATASTDGIAGRSVIKKAPILLSVGEGEGGREGGREGRKTGGVLVGRVRIPPCRGEEAREEDKKTQRIPVRVKDYHLHFLASRFLPLQ